jgi:hypothetical protein
MSGVETQHGGRASLPRVAHHQQDDRSQRAMTATSRAARHDRKVAGRRLDVVAGLDQSGGTKPEIGADLVNGLRTC